MRDTASWFGRRSSKLIIASSLFFVALGVVIWRLLPAETLEQAAHRFDDCLIDKDTGCMFDYMHPDELELLGLSQQEFDTFMETYVYAQLKGFTPKGSIRLELHESQTQLFLESSRVFSHPDGREVMLVFDCYMGDEHPIMINAILGFVVGTCHSDLKPGEPTPSGLAKFELLIGCYKKYIPAWQTAGLHGYTRSLDSGSGFELRRFDGAILSMQRSIAEHSK